MNLNSPPCVYIECNFMEGIKIKIAVFTDYFLPENNGVVQYIYNLSKELIKENNEIHIVTFQIGDQKDLEFIDSLNVHRFKGVDCTRFCVDITKHIVPVSFQTPPDSYIL